MKMEADKEKQVKRKKDIKIYSIFNEDGEQLQNKISIIFKEHLDTRK